MGFRKFSLLIALRTTLLLAVLTALVQLINVSGYMASTMLVALILIALIYEFFIFVSKTNKELTRFLDAARYADYSQRFQFQAMGAGFGELGDAFTDILDRFRTIRSDQEKELRRLKALIEHVPVPLITIHHDGHITLWNNAARRLFGTARISKLSDMAQFGKNFAREMERIQPGERKLAVFKLDGVEKRLSIGSSQIIFEGKSEQLVSLQDIQSELDVMQLQAWQDLVRVLTHEIMNSITPVASLAKTAADLVDDAKSKVTDRPDVVEELADVADAVNTVARRSDGLMNFVTGFRQLTRLPPPKKKTITLDDLISRACVLGTQGWDDKHITLSIDIHPKGLDASLDADMMEQVLINILQNAEQALENKSDAGVTIRGFMNRQGRPTLEISDNGPGIPKDILPEIFVPFFTTKRQGSGVGLALTRQVLIAHGGSVSVRNQENGGACFTLTF